MTAYLSWKYYIKIFNLSLPKTSYSHPFLPWFQPCVCIYVSHIRTGKFKHSQILGLVKLSIKFDFEDNNSIRLVSVFKGTLPSAFLSFICFLGSNSSFCFRNSIRSRWRCNDFWFLEIRKVLLFGQTSFKKIEDGNAKNWNFFSLSYFKERRKYLELLWIISWKWEATLQNTEGCW